MENFQQYKENLCREIYLTDVCYGHENLMTMFRFEECKVPAFGYADILYLVATAPNMQYLKRRLENYKGYSRWLEQRKGVKHENQ